MSERLTIPVLPLRDVVLFPGVTAPIGAGRPGTLRAIEAALATPEKLVFAVSQRENVEQVNPENLYTIGTIARIGQLQRGLAGMQLLLHGERRGIAMHVVEKDGFLQAVVRDAEELAPLDPEDPAFLALHREARSRAAELGQKSGLPEEVIQQVLAGVHDAGAILRSRRRVRRHHAGAAADPARDAVGRGPAPPPAGPHPAADRGGRRAGGHQVAGAGGARRAPARDVPPRAAEDDPPRARRGRRVGRPRGAARASSPRSSCPTPPGAKSTASSGAWAASPASRWSRRSSGPTSRRSPSCRGAARSDEHLDLARGPAHPRRRPLRPRRREGSGARVPGGAPAPRGAERQGSEASLGSRQRRRRERSDPALRRPSGRRQDLDGQVDRPRDGAGVRAHLPRRRARRGRHPRPPAHLRRCDAGPHPPGDEAGRHPEPGLPARRGRQARRLLPGRPGRGAARGARPGAERLVRRSLSRRAVRPERGAVHRHRQLPAEHPGAAARPDGDGRVQRVHRTGEARDRAQLPDPAPAGGERALDRADRAHRRRPAGGHLELHPRGGRPAARARAREARPQGGAPDRREGGRAGDGEPGRRGRPARPAAGLPRARRPGGPGRRRDRHVLHAHRRRHHVRRGLHHARQGRTHPDRPARRRHEGVGARRVDLRALARRRAAHPGGGVRPRPAHPRPRRCHPEGRAVRRRHHGDRARLGAVRPAGAPRHRHDR